MSCSKDDLDQSEAFTQGHNDAWQRKSPLHPCACLSCPTDTKYKEGHRAGTTARYYYDKGYHARKELA